MKTTLSSASIFLIVGAVVGYCGESSQLRYLHIHGLALPLQDWMYASFNAALFGVIGCITGLVIGLILNWLTGRRGTPDII